MFHKDYARDVPPKTTARYFLVVSHNVLVTLCPTVWITENGRAKSGRTFRWGRCSWFSYDYSRTCDLKPRRRCGIVGFEPLDRDAMALEATPTLVPERVNSLMESCVTLLERC